MLMTLLLKIMKKESDEEMCLEDKIDVSVCDYQEAEEELDNVEQHSEQGSACKDNLDLRCPPPACQSKDGS